MSGASFFPRLATGATLLMLASSKLIAQEEVTIKHLAVTGSHLLRITYDCTFAWPPGGGYEAVLRLPVPPETGAQHIEHFTSSLKGKIETDDAMPPHRLLMATLHHEKGDARQIHWRIEMLGQFETRQLMDGPPAPGTVIVAPAAGEYLASTDSINWKTEGFQHWLDKAGLRRKAHETPVAYGQRLYDYFQTHGRYQYPPETSWNAAAVCRRLRTDCGGFSLVFTAACRANHIPARVLSGQCFKARQQGGSVELTGERQSHVIAEFFDPQIGWIPEDISAFFLKTPGYPDLNFYGRDPGYFFTWHVDTDFRFDTPQKPNAKVQWIQNPSPWFSANASAVYDSLSHHWTVETVK